MTGTDIMPGGVPDTFTGTNGTSIASSTNWTQADAEGTGFSATLQSGQGRLGTGTVTGNRYSLRSNIAARLNQEIVFDWVVPVANTIFPSAWVRSASAIDGASGYYFTLIPSTMTVGYGETTHTYADTDLVTVTHGFTAGQIVRTRIAVFTTSGTTKTLKARTWLVGNSEPTSTWQINTTDTHVVDTAGVIGFTIASNSTGTKFFFIDNFDAFDTETPSQATLAANGTVTPTGVLGKIVIKNFAGGITPSGALTKSRAVTRAFSGGVTPTGVLVKVMPKNFSGVVTPVGTFVKLPRKNFSGVVTPTATLRRTIVKKFAGAITPVGTLVVLNVGRVFGRPGVVVMNWINAATVTIRHRRE